MNNYFTVSELCIDQDAKVPQDIADKILLHHILVMNPVRHELGEAIFASENSGWRPLQWELARGRSGGSQHTFKFKGAVDWTIGGVEKTETDGDFQKLFELICEMTPYTRIAVYPQDEGCFIHCDYAAEKRQLFLSDSRSNWELVTYEEIIAAI